MICKPCIDANHSACAARACECPDCLLSAMACRQCRGDGEYAGARCTRCQGSGRELADLAGVDRIGGGHGGQW